MANISGSIRLAVDSGDVALGIRSALAAIKNNTAKLIIVASENKKGRIGDIEHLAKLANLRVYKFEGNSMNLGAVCGKPYSVSVLAIIDAGNSNLLNEV